MCFVTVPHSSLLAPLHMPLRWSSNNTKPERYKHFIPTGFSKRTSRAQGQGGDDYFSHALNSIPSPNANFPGIVTGNLPCR